VADLRIAECVEHSSSFQDCGCLRELGQRVADVAFGRDDRRVAQEVLDLRDRHAPFRQMVLLQSLHAKMSSSPHVHDDAAELYVVLKGELHVVTDSESIRVSQGSVALVPAGVPHGVRNEHPEEEVVSLVLLGVSFHKNGVRSYPLPSNTL
jgi:mannose-6-phosphate isomerase-like protein (cupin superfamily)